MATKKKKKKPAAKPEAKQPPAGRKRTRAALTAVIVLALVVVAYAADPFSWFTPSLDLPEDDVRTERPSYEQYGKWVERAYKIGDLFRVVYTAGWEGANGAIGDAHLFAVTGDTTLLEFHRDYHPMEQLFNGTWVDDRAWAALAEMYWWDFTGRTNESWVRDAEQRYLDARREGRFSNHEGFWSWYNWPPDAQINEQIFTNSNMNQMATAAAWLYEATGRQEYLDEALLVWKGDGEIPGVIQTQYKGGGVWEGAQGRAAFGKQLPWEGASYCSIGAAIYRVIDDPELKKQIKDVIVATAKHVMDPANGWVDPKDYYQIHMDGNGAFVHFLLDAYMIAPDELPDIPGKVGKMLEHVWTNHHGQANVTLHRFRDHGIRNGWNPNGGEDGYGVNQVGTVHPQSQALRAFGVYAYVVNKYLE